MLNLIHMGGATRLAFRYLQLLRPVQWTKNLLIFAALVFSGQVALPGQMGKASLAFGAFCLVASGLYIFNDILDRKADSHHPKKKARPIASGAIRWNRAAVLMLVLVSAGFFTGRWMHSGALACLLAYFVLQVAYSLILKRVVIIDAAAISAGFVLRAAAGALAIQVDISPWFLVCVMLAAFFLALAKRRWELAQVSSPAAHRWVLGEYSLPLLDQMIAVVTSSTLMAYVLYTFAEQTRVKFPSQLMPLTIPFVLYGIFRYLYLIHNKSEGGEPETLLFRDIPLFLDVLLWLAVVAAIVTVK